MSPKLAWTAMALLATALAGCTAGSDGDGDSETTSGTGGVGVGGTVSGPGGGVGGNATVSGSATATSTSTNATGSGANATADVSIEGGAYVPDVVTVRVGGTVTWTHNDGATQHTVTADDGSFDSSPGCNQPVLPLSDCMTQGETFTATFATAGEYGYHDKVDPSITGTVRVVEDE